MSPPEPPPFSALKSWLTHNGGGFHTKTRFTEDLSGSHVTAAEALGPDTCVVECPFGLVVTKTLAKNAILDILQADPIKNDYDHQDWTERQWICTYLVFHSIIGAQEKRLAHFAYLGTLPSPDKLRTPLHFTPLELEIFKGTNLYGATLDREREWKMEWNQCRAFVEMFNSSWGNQFSWDKYLSAATYLSSRAFPSTLLGESPSLVGTASTEPILIPGVDSLNHKRGEPVSWVVTKPTDETSQPKISLLLHSPAISGQELFNNYGPKPNSELILGYGFSLPQNPDDTMVLKVGGIAGKKWEIGRRCQGVDGLWKEILSTMLQSESDEPTYEDILDASGMLQEMVVTLIQRLPDEGSLNEAEIRPEVITMFRHYLEGQKDILQSLMEFTGEREQEAIDLARQQGIEVQLEED